MRTLLNILVVVMLAGILVGVVMIHSSEGIKQDRFYLLADEDTNWHAACLARLEDIRLRRNPTFGVIAGVD